MMMVMVVMMMVIGTGICETYGNWLDYTVACTNDIEDAFNYGEEIQDYAYYYDESIYFIDAHINPNNFGLDYKEDEFDIFDIKELEEAMANFYKELGMRFCDVQITRVGYDKYNEESIYRVEINTMTNLNKDFENELGNCFIGEGKAYNRIVGLCEIGNY